MTKTNEEHFDESFGQIADGKFGGELYLWGYAHPLPAALTSVGGGLYLWGYAHPLPAGLKNREAC